MLLCIYTRYNLFAHSSCTSLFILLFIKSTVCCFAHLILLHILLFIESSLFFCLPIFIFSCVVLCSFHCPLSGPDLTYISLRIIFCIIEYVTNKTLNLEPLNPAWTPVETWADTSQKSLKHHVLLNGSCNISYWFYCIPVHFFKSLNCYINIKLDKVLNCSLSFQLETFIPSEHKATTSITVRSIQKGSRTS